MQKPTEKSLKRTGWRTANCRELSCKSPPQCHQTAQVASVVCGCARHHTPTSVHVYKVWPHSQAISLLPHGLGTRVLHAGPIRLKPSLIPRPPPFLPSVCVHNNTQKQKTSKKTGKSWEHSSHEWTRGGRRGEGPIFKYVCT